MKSIQDTIEQEVSEVSGEVSFEDLFNQGFAGKHSRYATFGEILRAGGIKATTKEEFELLPQEKLDDCIRLHTSFVSWDDFCRAAASEYMARGLRKAGLRVE